MRALDAEHRPQVRALPKKHRQYTERPLPVNKKSAPPFGRE